MAESRIQPRRGRTKRFLEGDGFIVSVEVPVIYAPEEPGEPLLEAATIRFLDEVTEKVRACDFKWLSQVGEVYERKSA